MSNFSNILKSFSIQETLNPKIWENPKKPSEARMKPRVRTALLKIAEEFIEYLGDDIFVEDIVLTGSLSNFNWSEYSDFDLHVIVNLQDYEDEAPLYKEIFDLKKFVFNERHKIKIFGYDVELYAQDLKEPHIASGVYSIMNDEWVNEPKKIDFEIDQNVLKDKIECWTDKIDKAVSTESSKDDLKVLENLKKRLKEYRQSGLEKNGELSYENLVFKFLRRSGHIKRLFDSMTKAVDKELSLERKPEE
jgi:predicted nucleotidyltransferase